MKCPISKKYILILLKHITLMFILLFITINSIALLKMSKQLSKKNFSNLIISGQFGYLSKKEIIKFILSLQKPNDFLSKYDTFIQNKLKNLPFVKKVIVRRKWPNTLIIYIINIIPIAYWNDKYVLDKLGTMYDIPKKIDIKNIPHFYGPKDSQTKILNNYIIIRNILTENNISLKSIIVTLHNSWELIINENLKIALGSINNISRLKKLMHIWKILKCEENVKKKKIKYIDLRYKLGIAIGWK